MLIIDSIYTRELGLNHKVNSTHILKAFERYPEILADVVHKERKKTTTLNCVANVTQLMMLINHEMFSRSPAL